MKKPVFRPGTDWARIVDPRLFQRCGYPLSIVEEEERLKNDPDIVNAVQQAAGIKRLKGRAYSKLLSALAFAKVSSERFGGTERRIHLTEPYEDLRGKELLVVDKFTCVTGDYFPPSYYGGDEYDYDPGGLSNSKVHVILQLNHRVNNYYPEARNTYKRSDSFNNDILIPATQVTLLKDYRDGRKHLCYASQGR